MNTFELVLSEKAKIIHIEGYPLVAGVHWNQVTETISNTKKIIGKKSPSEVGVIIETPIVTQVAFLNNDLDGLFVGAKPIIAHILAQENVSSLWIFYASADIADGSVWCLVGDIDGVLHQSSEKFITEDELFELLDEHVLVSDSKLNIFTDNPSFIDDFEDLSSLVVTEIDFTDDGFFDTGIAKKLTDRKVFGLPPILFHISVLFFVFTAIVQLSSRFIEPPVFDMLSPPKHVSDKIRFHHDWKTLSPIYSKSQSITSFINNISSDDSLLKMLPNNIYGWDLKDIQTNNDLLSFNLVLNSTGSSIGFLKKYLLTNTFPENLVKKYKPSISLNSDNKAMNISISFTNKEEVFNGMEFLAYKESLRRNDVAKKINSANTIRASIQAINDEGVEYESKYMETGKISLVISFLLGHLTDDQETIDDLYEELDTLSTKHATLLTYINDLPRPDSSLLSSVLYDSDATSLFSISQESHLFNVQYNTDADKPYTIFNVTFKAPNTPNLLNILNKFKTIYNVPLRIKTTNYNWLTSEWSITGEIYAPKTTIN